MSTDQEFAALVTERMPALLRYAHVLTGDRARAEDLVQSALAAAYRHRRRIHPEGAEAYVRKAVLNEHLSWWRRRRSRERVTDRPPDRPVPDGASGVDERDAMWAALARLGPRQRAVLVLRYYEDLSEAEIARVLDVSPGTVKSQAAKALASLRATLASRDRQEVTR